MKINDPVHLYEGEWFNEGRVTSVDAEGVVVDFCDWVQRYQPSELKVSYIFYRKILVVSGKGEIVSDFRD